jgi:iron complex transport system substrate-binding protein
MKRIFFLGLVVGLSPWAAEIPRRIVSLSPNMTELLYGIGAFDQIVGISDYCTYPSGVNKLPSVGGWHDPNLERIAILHPDLVILDDGQAPFVEDRFKRLGLQVIVVSDRSIEDVYTAIRTLGHATGREEGAARLLATTREGLLRVSRKTASSLSKPAVLLIVDRTPGTLRDLNTATERSFLGELVKTAGGRIVAPPFKREYGELNKEDLLAINPDIILDFIHGAKSRFAGNPMEAWRVMPELKAVRTRRVHGVSEDFVPHASQRMVQTAELFVRLIHPEVR